MDSGAMVEHCRCDMFSEKKIKKSLDKQKKKLYLCTLQNGAVSVLTALGLICKHVERRASGSLITVYKTVNGNQAEYRLAA